MNIKIGIIGPTEAEIKPLIDELENAKVVELAMLKFYEGTFHDVNIVSLYCGVCKVNAAIASQILIDKFQVTHIIVCGVAGAISNHLKIGDTVISTELAYHDVSDNILTEYHPYMGNAYFTADLKLLSFFKNIIKTNVFKQNIYFGKIVTGEAFIVQDGRENIVKKYNPLCVDMETASIAHVCYVNNIPFIAIRSITDTEEHCGVDVFEENCISASLNSLEIVKIALKEFNNF